MPEEKAIAEEKFGKMLRRMRNERNWTLREMAGEAGINFAYLSQLEAGLAKPSTELIEKLADVFDLKGRDREKFIFVGQEIREQIQEIRQKFPTLAPQYFRKVPRGTK
jgi:transcriptional regulator with XRE-family HTH domain